MSEPLGVERQIVMNDKEFSKFRNDPTFHRALTLARIVNSIRFNQYAIAYRGEERSPAFTRQGASALFYLAAILREAFKFVNEQNCREHFKHYRAWSEHMEPLLRDKSVRKLRDGVIRRLRDQAIYHHDEHVISAGLEMLEADEYVLLSILGDDVYWDLADTAHLLFALRGSDATAADYEGNLNRLGSIFGQVEDVAARFSDAAEILLKEYTEASGWKLKS